MIQKKQIIMIQPSDAKIFDEQGWCVYSVTSRMQSRDFDVVRYFVSAEKLTQAIVRSDFQSRFPRCSVVRFESNEYRKEWR